MKAAVLEEIEKLTVKDIAKPKLEQAEILIKVDSCNICGTDINLFKGKYTAKMPVVIGHEWSGHIVELGSNANNFKIGERVVSDPNEACGMCYWCRSGKPCFCNNMPAYGVLKDGGFAEYIKITAKGAYKIPEGLDYESAAFAEPVSCAVHGIDKASVKQGETVVIIGGGAMGQIILQLALSAGASKLIMIEQLKSKLELAKKFGATDLINAKEEDVIQRTLDLTNGLGADVVIEVVGNPKTVELAIKLVKKSGRVVIFGFSPEGEKANIIPFEILSKELTIMGAWVNPYTSYRALEILASGKIDVKSLISIRLPLDKIMDGINLMIDKPEGFIRAVIKPGL
jgi:2-desacetyl-2-hydroxyethyl bacteriochlorophyllide A dehydrogenase